MCVCVCACACVRACVLDGEEVNELITGRIHAEGKVVRVYVP